MPRPSDRTADPAAVARHYDALDGIYRAVWGEHVHHGFWITGRESPQRAVEQLVELVAGAARIAAGARVCDVGCGYGATARALVATHGAHVTGITVSPAQARFAQASGPAGNPRIVLGDWLANGLPDGSFDAVIAIESISHMPDRERVFAQCHRVLAPGGRLVVLDWLAPERPRAWQRRRLLEPICRAGHLPSLDSLAGYGALAQRAGFEALAGRDISRHVWRTWPVVLARAAPLLARDPALRRLVLDRSHPEYGFVPMIVRLMVGYTTRGFRYGMLTARRPPQS